MKREMGVANDNNNDDDGIDDEDNYVHASIVVWTLPNRGNSTNSFFKIIRGTCQFEFKCNFVNDF